MSDNLFPEIKKLITNLQRVNASEELPATCSSDLSEVMTCNDYSNSLRRSLKRVHNVAEVYLTTDSMAEAINALLKEHGLKDTWVQLNPNNQYKGAIRSPKGILLW